MRLDLVHGRVHDRLCARFAMQRQLSWFLPESLRRGDRDDMRRAQLVVAGSLLASGVSALIALLQIVWGIPQSALVAALCALVCAGLPLCVRATGAWRAAGAALCGSVW